MSSVSVPLTQVRTQFGIATTIYYGYRAWGPNWAFDPAWTKGSAKGFIADVDGAGNRFNPNKLLLDPYTKEMSHDPENPQNTDGTVFASGPSNRLKDSGQARTQRHRSCRFIHPCNSSNRSAQR